ncbi:MAG: hypothetical protein KKH41_01595 [Candidatus Thermoplasmatota archaeon]|nr:hypothetical protein [Euryarchaeota archaeon]MBU4031868.1 hypothetical protein [Candidatus Thermoplasmatota archaeon]MBU4070694.1 hypothetical protein [Candidatus Thermoplasmatota archaeon]MBU4145262.1 hypothetical protein [Candidatus Thermoplasmatota archaeon]MBU4591256.1 hypothetical protein [Candidatus Thermoplasmatota archaeon]
MSSDKAYITILGRSSWAMVNSYYAVLRQENFLPDVIHIFTEKKYESYAPKIREAFGILNSEFGIKPSIDVHTVEDVDFIAAGKQMSETIQNLKRAGMEVALDITPGRKALIIGALIPAMKQDLEHIYYLEITDMSDAARPYMEIPLQQQKLWDLKAKGATR